MCLTRRIQDMKLLDLRVGGYVATYRLRRWGKFGCGCSVALPEHEVIAS